MNKVFRTSIWYRYGYAIMVIISCLNICYLEQLSSKIPWAINAIVFLFLLFRNTNNRVYIRIKDDMMTVNSGSKPNTFHIDDIDHIIMNYHPLGKSYFHLKDGGKINFDPWVLSDKEADSLKEVCSDVRG